MSVEDLIKMQASEFADTETQKTREKERSNAEQSVLLTSSRNDDLNSKIRAVMSGSSEDWRSKSSSIDANDNTQDNNYNDSSQYSSKKRKIETDSKPTSRSEEIEKSVSASLSKSSSASAPTRKRPLDVDAGTRISANKVTKLSNLDISNPSTVASEDSLLIPVVTPTADLKPATTQLTESPKAKIDSPRVKAPNLLDILKANPNPNNNNNNNINISSNTNNNNIITLPESIRSEDIQIVDNDEELITSSGGKQFVLKYAPKASGGITHSIPCKGFTKDSKIQRVLKEVITIDGRVKVAEMDKFLNEVISSKKKILVKFKFTFDESSSSLIEKFCNEYEKDGRVGVCNAQDGSTSLYLIPPSLQKSVSCLAKSDKISKNSLYAVLIAKSLNPSLLGSGEDNVSSVNLNINTTSSIKSGTGTVPSVATTMKSQSAIAVNIKAPSAFDVKPPAAPSIQKKPMIPSKPVNAFSNLTSSTTTTTSSIAPTNSTSNKPNAIPPMPVAPVKSIPPAPIVPVLVTKSIPPPPLPPLAASTSSQSNQPIINQDEKILNIAQYCAAHGVPAMDALREKPDSRITLPFLFDDHPLYHEFIRVLKMCLGKM